MMISYNDIMISRSTQFDCGWLQVDKITISTKQGWKETGLGRDYLIILILAYRNPVEPKPGIPFFGEDQLLFHHAIFQCRTVSGSS